MIAPVYTFKEFPKLTPDEIKLVWKWRNDERIRQWMYNEDEIPFEDHLRFLESLKNNYIKRYWLVYRNNQPLGVYSVVDILFEAGEWGYYIEPDSHDKKLGIEFFYYTLQAIFETHHLETLYCYTLVDNEKANSLSDLFGFSKEEKTRLSNGQEKEYFYRELTKESWLYDVKRDKTIQKLLSLTADK